MSEVISEQEGRYHFIAYPAEKEETIYGDMGMN